MAGAPTPLLDWINSHSFEVKALAVLLVLLVYGAIGAAVYIVTGERAAWRAAHKEKQQAKDIRVWTADDLKAGKGKQE